MGVLLAAGQIIGGDYRVVAPLSQGGMGSVYVVEQLSTAERRALKLMHPSIAADERSRARFEQEARVSGRIASAHVVKVIQSGVDEALGVPWLCMELLEGEDLGAALRRRGALPAADAAALFEQIGHALAIAHALGIVHRDLKPENLFLATPQTPGVPFTAKVLDFGIAKLVAGAQTTEQVGSPMWMAPEQANGEAITPATDVWAMGLIAFRVLAGKPYWRAANTDETHITRLITEILTGPIVAASARAAELCAAPIPAGFDAWFARCVARDASARFPDAGAARDALLPLLRGQPDIGASALEPTVPLAAVITGRVLPTPPPARRRRLLLAVIAACVVASTAAVALALRRTRAPSTTRRPSGVGTASTAAPLIGDGCMASRRCDDPLRVVCHTLRNRCEPSPVAGELRIDLDGAPARWVGVARAGTADYNERGGRTQITLTFGEGGEHGFGFVVVTLPKEPSVGRVRVAERGLGTATVMVTDNGAVSARYRGGFEAYEGELLITRLDHRLGGIVEATLDARVRGGNAKPPIEGTVVARIRAELPH